MRAIVCDSLLSVVAGIDIAVYTLPKSYTSRTWLCNPFFFFAFLKPVTIVRGLACRRNFKSCHRGSYYLLSCYVSHNSVLSQNSFSLLYALEFSGYLILCSIRSVRGEGVRWGSTRKDGVPLFSTKFQQSESLYLNFANSSIV